MVALRHQFSPGDVLYFVIRVQGEVADKVADLASTVFRENRLAGARRPKRVLHVTLCCVGTWGAKPTDFWERIEVAVRRVVIHPFMAEFDYVMNFGRNGEDHAIVLVGGDGVIGFYMLFDSLRKGLREAGFALASSYTPHITIIYDRRSASEGYVAPIRWVVREIALVCSLIGKSKHVPLKEWPLAG